MALFKHFRGNRAFLDAQPLHDGYAYFCVDDGTFHIDYADPEGNLHRKQINAKEAEALTGYSIETLINSSDVEIPTSKAVSDALSNKVDKISGKGLSTNDYTTAEKNKLAGLADVATSGSYNDLADKPTIPSITGLATETYVDNKVAGLVDSSPEALNTLNELAAALGDDPNFATTVSTEIGKKVDKTTTVNGHALSGNVTVTKSDVGLGNVPNVATNDQTPTFTEATTLENIATGEKVSTLFGKIKKAITDLIAHLANKSNPHGVTKAQVGLGSVVNTGDSATPVSGGTTKFTTGGAYTELAKKVDKSSLATVATSGKYSDLSGTPTSMTPTAHNQASNTINAMTGYSKPSSTGAIGTSDTLNAAIGKLEKALDGKQASGSYSATGHKHTKSEITDFPTSMTPTAHNQAANTINAMTGYSKPSSTGAIAATDTLNAAIGKLEKALDGKQASGSYSTTGHKHTKSEITDFPALATVATSGSYNDLSNKPTIPEAITVDSALSSTSTNPVQNKVINTALGNKVDKVSGKGLSTNDLTATLKANYDAAYTHSTSAHAPSNAEKNQNAFSNVVVGSTTIAADTTTDSLTLVGSNVTLTPDATNDKVTIGITKANVTSALGYTPPTTNTTYNAATQSAAGLMSAADKKKLDGIATGANNYTYTLPAATSTTLGGIKVSLSGTTLTITTS